MRKRIRDVAMVLARNRIKVAMLAIFVGFVLSITLFPKSSNIPAKELSESAFYEEIFADDVVDVIKIEKNEGGNFIHLTGSLKTGDRFNVTVDTHSPRYQLIDRVPKIQSEQADKGNPWIGAMLPMFVMLILIVGSFVVMGRGRARESMDFSKSNAPVVLGNIPAATFDSVAGVDEAKQEVQEIVNFLRDPQKFARLGGRVPRGVLLAGPPGAGKTLLARAAAGEAGVPFFSKSGSEFVELYVGRGAARVRELFAQAKQHASAIIFIDELDAVGRSRVGARISFAGNDEREQTLNQLLVEMDGFQPSTGIIVFAATNRPDVLDPALLRPGRFDRRVVLDAPDRKGREAILRIHAKGKVFANAEEDLAKLAEMTAGLLGADLANILNEAALAASQTDAKAIEWKHLQAAEDKVAMGAARTSKRLSEREKEIVSFHEVGHALVGHVLGIEHRPTKMTCIMHGQSLGHTRFASDEDIYLRSKSQFRKELATTLGGRAAEVIFCGGEDEVTNGASNDIQRATEIAERMVTSFGMGNQGPIDFALAQEHEYLGGAMPTDRAISEQTLQEINREVKELLARALQEGQDILRRNEGVARKTAALLMEKETLHELDFLPIFQESK